MDSVGNFWNGW